jgi:ADP-ribose pyrophosphatase YjhB (NUDIX family)
MLDYIRMLREKIGNTKIIVPGVRALIFNERKELLLEKQRHFGSWSLPHGCIDVGESAYDAVKREIQEETGLIILHANPFGLYTDPKYSITYPNGDEVQTFTVAFVVTKWTGEPTIDDDEVDELDFFALDNLPEPFYDIHMDTVIDYKNGATSFILK